jgi:GDP-D-mannose 3',5'-epimerase
MTKKILICGAGGFIGNHLVKKLKEEGNWVRGLDIKKPEFGNSEADEFIMCDLRNLDECKKNIDESFDESYQLAADMGGATYLFTGEHDADVLSNNSLININVLKSCQEAKVKKVFFASSACIYPTYNQEDPNDPKCSEDSAYPALPDSEYGWEKLFSERLYESFRKDHGLKTYIARFHGIIGPEGTWKGKREKAPAAICRKVIESKDKVEIIGGNQTRSFLYIDDCLEAISLLMNSNDFYGPVNIGSEEIVTINQLVSYIFEISGKNLKIESIQGPLGVKGRNSDNKLIKEKLGWQPKINLKEGIKKVYYWINEQINSEQTEKSQIIQTEKF